MSFTQKLSGLALGRAAFHSGRENLKVLLVAPYAPRGGGMGRLMDYLAVHQVAGIDFQKVESRGGGPALTSLWHVLVAACRIAIAAAGGPTIVHVNMAERSSLWRKGILVQWARVFDVPVLIHVHAAELISCYDTLPLPARALVRVTFRSANCCIVLGETWRAWLIATIGVAPGRVQIIRNGVPRPIAIRLRQHGARFYMIFLGNLLPRKGLIDLLHALASSPLRDLDWHLTVIGSGDATLAKRVTRTLNIAAKVHFTGWLERSDVSLAIKSADALVLPAYHEALPLVLLEAAGAGLPVVATNVGAIGECFVDGQTALLVEPGNRRMLAEAIRRLICDHRLAERLAQNGRAVFDREFTLDLFAERLRKLYLKLATNYNAGVV